MDSRATQSHANTHEYDHQPHNFGSQQVARGVEEHHDDHEKKSVLKKVKAKAKKIKDTITKHGPGHEYHYEDQHIHDDHDLHEEDDEDEDMVQDPEIHGAPIYDSAGVRNATPGQVKTSEPGVQFGGTTVMGEEPHHEPRVVVVSPITTEINQSRSTDPARTFVREEKAVQPKVDLERPMDLEKDPHAPGSRLKAYAHANYQTKVTDPTGAGGAEIDIAPVEKSFDRMTVHNEQKPIPEPKILPTVAETHYPSSAGSHHQFASELSTATKTHYPSTESHDQNLPSLSSEIKTQYPKSHDQLFTPDLHHPSAKNRDQNLSELSNATKTQYPSAGSHDQFMSDLSDPSATSHDQNLSELSTATKTQYPSGGSHDQFTPEFSTETETLNNNNITVEEQPQPPHESNQSSSYTDKISSATSAIANKAITAKDAVASKLGYGEKGDDNRDENVTSGEKPSNQSSYTEKISSATSTIADKAASAKNTVATKLGFGEKTEEDSTVTSQKEEEKSETAASAATSGSPREYGKRTALSLTEKLAPVYGKVPGVGSAVKSKGNGERGSGGVGQDKGVSVKDYLAEKLRPGEEDKALSEVISGSLYKKGEDEEVYEEEGVDRNVRKVVSDAVHKRAEEVDDDEGRVREERRPMGKVTESEEVKRRLGSGDDEEKEKGYEESFVNSPGKGVVDKLKGVVGSWFGKPGENQSSPGSGDLTRNSGAEVEQVNQAAGERRLQESTN